jgi:uncharacterized iron-regulated membrane protein
MLVVHRVAGLFGGLLLAVTGLSGSLLVFHEELDALLNPSLLRVAPQRERIPVQSALDLVRRAYPGASFVYIRMPRAADQVYELWMDAAGGLRVYVDPYAGTILGSRVPGRAFVGALFLLHTELFSGNIGKTIVGVGGLALLLLVGTGLVIRWPGLHKLAHGFLIQKRRGKIYNIHIVLGVAAAVFLAITAATGAALIFNAPFRHALYWVTATPIPSPPLSSTFDVRMPSVSLDAVLLAADAALPGAETTAISLPATPNGLVVVRKKFSEELAPNGRSFVYVDRYSGEVLRVENAPKAPLATRVFDLLYPVHIGNFGGLATRISQILVGLASAVLFLTGYLVWWMRKQGREKRHRFRSRTVTNAKGHS